ncbi:cell division protein ZipA [Paenibacillus sp. PvR133]|uniref:cell division protein ZipA C-terminal FtsZ-binding domain-containing protein n=1 Tax=Paenibacillus sp. PvR133 TaxID=2806598 RepID=UPI001AE57129|nr:cell division protein ZipA C-terminal FtsZ-binding domain-containing protein [Paenibacillus sp. PvR133]MBP1177595.1 cell division protein ZipA [Paenibacillus sp. PvR133]
MNLPEHGSEDVSSILAVELEHEPVKAIKGIHQVEPDANIYWLIDVEFSGFTLSDEDILQLLKGYIVYGHVHDLQMWTSVGRRSAGECHFDKICICIDIFDNVEMHIRLDEAKVADFMNTLPARFQEKGTVHVLPREDAACARAKAEKLKAFTDQEGEREHAVMLRLVADQGQSYRGADIWDVMLSLGMEWGDMDIFHAHHHGLGGYDELFSVHTGTEPGFFWLSTLAEDRFADLIFSMDGVRTVQPQTVFEAMWKSAEYARARLGGTLVNEQGLPAVPEDYLRQIQEMEDRLREFGFKAGEDVVLFLF